MTQLENNVSRTLNSTEKTDDYLTFYKNSQSSNNVIEDQIHSRSIHHAKIANHYYDLVTDFYEYGWGSSFHFAYPFDNEIYENAIRRLEYFLSSCLKAGKGDKLLDIGCGIGGPMRAIAQFSNAKVIGLNNNAHQINKGIEYNKKANLDELCSFTKANFMEQLPFENNSFDGVYSLEAICYAPNREKVYKEILRVLKPNAYFACTDWCMTNYYDAANARHVQLKEGIAKGNGLFDLSSTTHLLNDLQKAGFKIIDYKDLAESGCKTPWYAPLESKWSIKGFRRTTIGRLLTLQMIRILESIKYIPKGSTAVTQFLNEGADSLVEAGKLKIFTPGFFFLAKKD